MPSIWQSYVACDLVLHPHADSVGREPRFEAVALFADVSGFTAISEALAVTGKSGAKELTTIFNAYFEPVIDLIQFYGGTASVTFTYAPLQPVILSPVVFTATHEPFDATTPITYVWDFGDGVTTTVATASVQHTYTVSGTQMVRVTAYNLCTLAGVTYQESITVAPLRIFLPLVLRNH